VGSTVVTLQHDLDSEMFKASFPAG